MRRTEFLALALTPLTPALLATALLAPTMSASADTQSTASLELPAPSESPRSVDERTAAVMAMLAPEAETQEAPSHLSFTPALGLSFAQPQELNAWLATHSLNNESIAGRITWAEALSLTTRYELTPGFRLGLRLEYADIQTSRKVTYNDVTAGMTSELGWLIPYATADLKIPVAPRLAAGLSVGAGLPIFYHLNLQANGANAGSQNGSATYGSNPIAAYVGLFATLEVSSHAELRLEAGYRQLNASSMTATAQGQDGWSGIAAGTPLNDSNGAAIPVDASAPYLEAGLTFRL